MPSPPKVTDSCNFASSNTTRAQQHSLASDQYRAENVQLSTAPTRAEQERATRGSMVSVRVGALVIASSTFTRYRMAGNMSADSCRTKLTRRDYSRVNVVEVWYSVHTDVDIFTVQYVVSTVRFL